MVGTRGDIKSGWLDIILLSFAKTHTQGSNELLSLQCRLRFVNIVFKT